MGGDSLSCFTGTGAGGENLRKGGAESDSVDSAESLLILGVKSFIPEKRGCGDAHYSSGS